MTMVFTAESATSRQDIVRIATLLLGERGYQGMSMRLLAQELGMSAPSLYHHFPSKGALLFAVLEDNQKDFLGAMALAVASAGADPVRQLEALVRAHVRFQIEKIEYARVYDRTFLGMGPLVEALSDQQRDLMRGLQRQHTENVRRILRSGAACGVMAVGDVAVTAFAIISLCDGVIGWYRADGRLGIEEIAQLYADLALKLAGAQASSAANRR
jgi:AcrR family transcriptional regulator